MKSYSEFPSRWKLFMRVLVYALLLFLLPHAASARSEAQRQLLDQFTSTGFESLNRFCDLPKTCMRIAPDRTSHRRQNVGADHRLVDIYEQTYLDTGLTLKYEFPVSKVKVGGAASSIDSSEDKGPRFRRVLVASPIWEGWQGVRVGATRAYVEAKFGQEMQRIDLFDCSIYFGSTSNYKATFCYYDDKILTIEWNWVGND